MKIEEKFFFIMCFCLIEIGAYPRDVMEMLMFIIPKKRCLYYLEKWVRLGFYFYRVNLEEGYIDEEELPMRYSALISPDNVVERVRDRFFEKEIKRGKFKIQRMLFFEQVKREMNEGDVVYIDSD